MTCPLKAYTDACISFVRKHLEGYFKMTFYKQSKKNILTESTQLSNIHLMCNIQHFPNAYINIHPVFQISTHRKRSSHKHKHVNLLKVV